MKDLLNDFINLLFPPVDSEGNPIPSNKENDISFKNQIFFLIIIGIVLFFMILSL